MKVRIDVKFDENLTVDGVEYTDVVHRWETDADIKVIESLVDGSLCFRLSDDVEQPRKIADWSKSNCQVVQPWKFSIVVGSSDE